MFTDSPKRNRLLATALTTVFCAAAANGAMADMSDSMAYTICKAEINAAYGPDARVKFQKIRHRGNYKVIAFVYGVAEKRIKATCEIDNDGKLVALTPAPSELSVAEGN